MFETGKKQIFSSEDCQQSTSSQDFAGATAGNSAGVGVGSSSERDGTPPKKKYRRQLHSSSRSSSSDSGRDSGGHFPSPNKRNLRKASMLL